MLSIPTADELMGSGKYLKNHPVETWNGKKTNTFNGQMKAVQFNMIRDRHLASMDAETRARAMMVLAGVYHGQAIRQVASV